MSQNTAINITVAITAGVPTGSICFDFTSQAFLDVGQWIVVCLQDLSQKRDVGDGKS